MTFLENLTNEIKNAKQISVDEALKLTNQDLDELTYHAKELRKFFCGDSFDLCTIINAKSGACSENCKFCAQSSHFKTNAQVYSLLSDSEIIEGAKKNESQGVLRYSMVTSGRKLSNQEVDRMCDVTRKIKEETNIALCCSFGLLDETQFRNLKEAGITRIHNNLETSRNHFPKICTTHTLDDKIASIKAAQKQG